MSQATGSAVADQVLVCSVVYWVSFPSAPFRVLFTEHALCLSLVTPPVKPRLILDQSSSVSSTLAGGHSLREGETVANPTHFLPGV